jgi:hypothetical protein
MAVRHSVSDWFLWAAVFVLAVASSKHARAYGVLDTDLVDLVVVGHVDDVKTMRIPPGSISPDELRWTTFTVRTVLQGEPRMVGKKITTQQCVRSFGPPEMAFRASAGRDYVVAFTRLGSQYAPGPRGYEVTTRTVELPAEAPLREKINLLLLATVRDCRDNAMICRQAFSGLREKGASLDSPYYDLLAEYRRFDAAPQPHLRTEAAYARLLLGDESAIARTMALAANDKRLAARLPDALRQFGDDAVTTLCLLAEGKCAKGGEDNALRVLREMKSPYALPTLIRCLDNPDGGVQYMAYSAIERTISKGQRMSSVDQFLGRQPGDGTTQLKFNPLPPHSVRLVEKMKQWWEGRGKEAV